MRLLDTENHSYTPRSNHLCLVGSLDKRRELISFPSVLQERLLPKHRLSVHCKTYVLDGSRISWLMG